ncbi:MAG TPA: class I SAM-dependent methyltransferase [Agriterribacter sp.]|nr:class I SAM-dependent methyltransferase [Agriterribacter sp.]
MKYIFLLVSVYLVFCAGGCHAQERGNEKTKPDSIYTYGKASPGGIGKFYFGREIAHVMGASGSDWLEREQRPGEENTQLAIEKMDISPGDVLADIGAGTGYYSFKLAGKVPRGKVYAVDIQDEMIAHLQNKKAALHSRNVEIIKGDTLSPNLPPGALDFAIMVDVYHELEYPHEMLQSIKKSLKKDGKILLMEYKGEDPEVRIKPLHKTTVQQLNKELAANGFRLFYQYDGLPIQHLLMYEQVDQ